MPYKSVKIRILFLFISPGWWGNELTVNFFQKIDEAYLIPHSFFFKRTFCPYFLISFIRKHFLWTFSYMYIVPCNIFSLIFIFNFAKKMRIYHVHLIHIYCTYFYNYCKKYTHIIHYMYITCIYIHCTLFTILHKLNVLPLRTCWIYGAFLQTLFLPNFPQNFAAHMFIVT